MVSDAVSAAPFAIRPPPTAPGGRSRRAAPRLSAPLHATPRAAYRARHYRRQRQARRSRRGYDVPAEPHRHHIATNVTAAPTTSPPRHQRHHRANNVTAAPPTSPPRQQRHRRANNVTAAPTTSPPRQQRRGATSAMRL